MKASRCIAGRFHKLCDRSCCFDFSKATVHIADRAKNTLERFPCSAGNCVGIAKPGFVRDVSRRARECRDNRVPIAEKPGFEFLYRDAIRHLILFSTRRACDKTRVTRRALEGTFQQLTVIVVAIDKYNDPCRIRQPFRVPDETLRQLPQQIRLAVVCVYVEREAAGQLTCEKSIKRCLGGRFLDENLEMCDDQEVMFLLGAPLFTSGSPTPR